MRGVDAAGVEAMMLCADTAHAVIEPLKAEVNLPFIDMIEEAAKAIAKARCSEVALVATQFTMDLPFYKTGLARRGTEAVIPPTQSQRDRSIATATCRSRNGSREGPTAYLL